MSKSLFGWSECCEQAGPAAAGAAELSSSSGRKGRRKAVSQEGRNQTKPLWRFAAKAEWWAGRFRKGDRHLHLPVCCLRPEELNLERLRALLPGETSTGTKPSTCPSGATCQTGLVPAQALFSLSWRLCHCVCPCSLRSLHPLPRAG